jgi:murE/murF fusion protein
MNKFGVFEIGMNKKGEIEELSNIIKPDVGIITNVSYAHIANFKSLKQIAYAKAEIIDNIKDDGSLILNGDDKFFELHKQIAKKKKINILSFGIKNKNTNIYLNNIKKKKKKYLVDISINKKNKKFIFSSCFENNIKNLLAAITVISLFKDIKKIDKNIFYNLKSPSGRGDIKKIKIYKKNIFLVDESYNSNPMSLISAIKNFDQIKIGKNNKHLLLGDMLELGKHSKKLHLSISKVINNSSVDKVNIIGKEIHHTFKNIKDTKKGLILNNKQQIFDLIKKNINNNDYLMIKGSNSTGLNNLTKYLKKEG